MNQNRSTAVMQRRSEPHDSLDDFPTPPWAARALCDWIGGPLHMMDCREPAANRGYMARALFEYFDRVEVADVHDYGEGYQVKDYLFGPRPEKTYWTITNPPFRLAEQFIDRALETSIEGVAMLLRTSFAEGTNRYQRLFSKRPPSHVLQFSERVVMHKGKIVNPDVAVTVGNKAGKLVRKKPSSATSYAWFVWVLNSPGPTRLVWIPPCRKQLQRPSDYAPRPEPAG